MGLWNGIKRAFGGGEPTVAEKQQVELTALKDSTETFTRKLESWEQEQEDKIKAEIAFEATIPAPLTAQEIQDADPAYYTCTGSSGFQHTVYFPEVLEIMEIKKADITISTGKQGGKVETVVIYFKGQVLRDNAIRALRTAQDTYWTELQANKEPEGKPSWVEE